MIISTRGRYALRVMIDLSEHNGEDFIPLRDIAERQNISEKYLENIIRVLTKEHYLLGVRGKGGGYRLTKSPEEYTVGSILRLTEGDLAPVACLEPNALPCDRAAECRTLPMWKGLNKLINQYFDNITLADLIAQAQDVGQYVI